MVVEMELQQLKAISFWVLVLLSGMGWKMRVKVKVGRDGRPKIVVVKNLEMNWKCKNPYVPLSKCEMPLRGDGVLASWVLKVTDGGGGRGFLGGAGKGCSLAESKDDLGVKLLQSTFPTAHHIPDFSREHLRTALMNIKIKDMPKAGRNVSVNMGTSKHSRPGKSPGYLLVEVGERPAL